MISIVVTTKNRKNDLIECIKSIQNLTFNNYEIIVVDDCSNDGTDKLTNRDFKIDNLTIYHLDTPHMMVKARNFGAKKAKGVYVLFIDDDNIIDKNMIQILKSFVDDNKEFGIVGPQMYYANNEKYLDYQKINFFTGKTTGVVSNKKAKFYISDGIPNVFMIKKDIFEKIGYFDERLIQTFTEPDFSFLALRFGYKTAIVNKAKTIHNILPTDNMTPRSLGGKFKQKAYCLMRNRSVMIKRYAKLHQKIIYLLFFSWAWFFIYSGIMLKFKRFDLILFYWYGFKDGLYYFFTNKFNDNLHKIIKEKSYK